MHSKLTQPLQSQNSKWTQVQNPVVPFMTQDHVIESSREHHVSVGEVPRS